MALVKSGLLHVLKNKVLLGQSHANLFMFFLITILHYNDRVEKVQQRPYGHQSLMYLLSGPPQKTVHSSRQDKPFGKQRDTIISLGINLNRVRKIIGRAFRFELRLECQKGVSYIENQGLKCFWKQERQVEMTGQEPSLKNVVIEGKISKRSERKCDG